MSLFLHLFVAQESSHALSSHVRAFELSSFVLHLQAHEWTLYFGSFHSIENSFQIWVVCNVFFKRVSYNFIKNVLKCAQFIGLV